MKIHFKQDSPLLPVTCSLLCPNTPFSTIVSDNLSLGFSLSLKNQVLYSYKTTSKIVILYIRVLNNELEEKRF